MRLSPAYSHILITIITDCLCASALYQLIKLWGNPFQLFQVRVNCCLYWHSIKCQCPAAESRTFILGRTYMNYMYPWFYKHWALFYQAINKWNNSKSFFSFLPSSHNHRTLPHQIPHGLPLWPAGTASVRHHWVRAWGKNMPFVVRAQFWSSVCCSVTPSRNARNHF